MTIGKNEYRLTITSQGRFRHTGRVEVAETLPAVGNFPAEAYWTSIFVASDWRLNPYRLVAWGGRERLIAKARKAAAKHQRRLHPERITL